MVTGSAGLLKTSMGGDQLWVEDLSVRSMGAGFVIRGLAGAAVGFLFPATRAISRLLEDVAALITATEEEDTEGFNLDLVTKVG